MSYSFENITIVGGGSSGWMTAATFARFFPDKNISIIESPDYPIVGVGESTLGQINKWTSLLGIEDKDFMKETDASYKMSIKFTDFYKKDAGGFHYPFGKRESIGDNFDNLNTWFFKKALKPETPVQEYARVYYKSMPLIENNRITNNSEEYPFDFKWDTAYHFDATKFGQVLKKNYCLPKGVNLIQDTVDNIVVNEDGIDYLILKSGAKHKADLYIDCTGFKSLLLSQTLKEEFISFNDILPNNKAWATHLPYIDKEKELECFTNSTAISNGWCWNIPLWSRIGTGYVYSDKFISDEEALEEFKQYLMSDKVIIPRTREQVDAMTFRPITMRVGIHNRTWIKNVVGIGLAAGFVEPLESNGLFTVHEFLLQLMRTLQRSDVYTQFDVDTYNTSTKEMFYEFAEFVAIHYALSNRDDTLYWKDVTRQKNRMTNDLVSRITRPSNAALKISWAKNTDKRCPQDLFAGDIPISAGMNYNFITKLDIDLMKIANPNMDYESLIEQNSESWEYWYSKNLDKAMRCPTLHDYLKTNIHTDK
jgi:tryptophan halogenase